MAVYDWQVLLTRASSLRRSGRLVEAMDAYERLLKINPDLAESWYNLGWLQRQTGRFEEALRSYEEALKRGVSDPEEVHLNRSVIFSDHLRDAGAAEAELREALSMRPGYVPAMLNLGNLAEDLGRKEEAKEAYRRSLEAEPDNMLALARFAGVSEIAHSDDPLIGKLRQALGRLGISAAERADLGFALGRLLDSVGAYEEAFDAYKAANAASRESLGPQFRGYDRQGHEVFVDRLIAAFPAPAERLANASETTPMLFICGIFRSGTTLAEQILAAHSGVTAGGELDLIPSLVRQHLQPYPESVNKLDVAGIEQLRKEHRSRLKQMNLCAGLVTDKRPDNFLHIPLIKMLFPTAKIVHTRRNPLDNLLSLYFLHLNADMAYALDLEDAEHWYMQYRRLIRHWKGLYSDDIFDLDYDELVASPRSTIEALLNFCGLDWEDACLSSHAVARPVKTASVWQVRRPLYRSSSGRWRNYARIIEPLRLKLDEHKWD